MGCHGHGTAAEAVRLNSLSYLATDIGRVLVGEPPTTAPACASACATSRALCLGGPSLESLFALHGQGVENVCLEQAECENVCLARTECE